MRWSARNIVLVGLGVAASGAAALWLYEQPNIPIHASRQAVDATMQRTPKDIAALEAEVARLKADKDQLAQLSGELKSDLTALHSQLARTDRNQESTGQRLNQIAEKIGSAGLEGSAVSTGDKEAGAVPLTPEEQREHAKARTQAEIGLMEATLRAEKPDPEWASTAQLALNTKLQEEAIPGVQLLKAECRTTLCRMEMSLDRSTAQESFRNLFDLVPWSGQSLIQLDTETGVAVMYLAREEHTLPQLTE